VVNPLRVAGLLAVTAFAAVVLFPICLVDVARYRRRAR
jgi:hypothetical protein